MVKPVYGDVLSHSAIPQHRYYIHIYHFVWEGHITYKNSLHLQLWLWCMNMINNSCSLTYLFGKSMGKTIWSGLYCIELNSEKFSVLWVWSLHNIIWFVTLGKPFLKLYLQWEHAMPLWVMGPFGMYWFKNVWIFPDQLLLSWYYMYYIS